MVIYETCYLEVKVDENVLISRAKWNIKTVDKIKANKLANELQVPAIIGQLLFARGMTEVDAAKRFLDNPASMYHDPFLMNGMKEAVDRIHQTIKEEEPILVFGDYDADGVTSTALLVRGLKQLGAHVSYYVPDRFREGYGPNKPAIQKAAKDGIKLIITVDTGIAACDEALFAKSLGLDYIVTDHHEPPEILPEAYCILNPKKTTCTYPFSSLAGVGVALKLVHGLYGRLPENLLSLAAVGTVSDLVPLTDENRWIVKEGIKQINGGTFHGIESLRSVCGFEDGCDSDSIGFGIGPRLNAAGRMAHAKIAVELLLSDKATEADEIAHKLDELNIERKAAVDEITVQAEIEAIKQQAKHQQVFVIAGKGWHEGVIGIAASRMVEKFYRPTLVLSIDETTGLAKGSARSIPGFNLYEALSSCGDLFEKFGGHEMAAGMTIQACRINELMRKMNDFAEQVLTSDMLIPQVDIDCCLRVEDINIDLITLIDKLSPFGVSNPKPFFQLEQTKIAQLRTIGKAKNHLKCVFNGVEANLDGIGFGLGEISTEISPIADVSAIGELTINEWNGFRKPQFMIRDLKIDEWQLFDWRNEQRIHQRLQELPTEKRICLVFDKKSINEMGLQDYSEEIITMTDILAEKETPSKQGKYLVILDLPDSQKQMEDLVLWANGVERIYAVFHHKEEHYFSALPSRDQFKWLYAYISQEERFPLNGTIERMAKYKGWSLSTLKFMINVFFDLDFVKIEKGFLTKNKEPQKKPLTESKYYQRHSELIKVEELFSYSSYISLKDWFDSRLCQDSSEKETINI